MAKIKKRKAHKIGVWINDKFPSIPRGHFKREKAHEDHHDRRGYGPRRTINVHVPDCDDRIQLKLAGLTGNLNFQLFRQTGCRVIVEVECGEKKSLVRGTVCNVGTDFLDIRKKDGKVMTILRDRISRMKWLDRDCPSDRHKYSPHG